MLVNLVFFLPSFSQIIKYIIFIAIVAHTDLHTLQEGVFVLLTLLLA